MKRRKIHLNSPRWPEFTINYDEFDGRIPSTYVKNWQEFISIVNRGELGVQGDEAIFRGQRNASWGLTPSIARQSKSGVYEENLARKHLDNFKFSIRGRTKIPVSQIEDVDIWALGQHYGLWTPLLDWTRSPFVAMFFAMETLNKKGETPKNCSRVVFCLNKSKLEKYLGIPNDLFVNPLTSDHDRLISQDGLFTISPPGETTLEIEILNILADKNVDIDDPNILKDFIFKIHIPMNGSRERNKCLSALRRMNLHYASLYPDLMGSSLHCNSLIKEILRKE